MNELKKNNIVISVFLIFVLILGKGFHQYIELKKEKRNNEDKILGLVRKHINTLLISVQSRDKFLMRENLRPFISLPFVSGIKIRAKKIDIINITKKKYTGRRFLFFKIPLKDRGNNKIGHISIYSKSPEILKYVRKNIVSFIFSILIHFFAFYFVLNISSDQENLREGS